MPNSLTEYLEAVSRGEPGASEALLEFVYDALRKIAAKRLGQDSRAEELLPTELVHEAWLRLGGNEMREWQGRFHFFSMAAEAMRRTLIDNARRRKSGKRGGPEARRKVLCDEDLVTMPLADELLDLDAALLALEDEFPAHAQVVKLKFFAGMKMAEIAEVMNVSIATVERYWTFAKAWLQQKMNDV